MTISMAKWQVDGEELRVLNVRSEAFNPSKTM